MQPEHPIPPREETAAASVRIRRVGWCIHLGILAAYLLALAAIGLSRYPARAPALSNSPRTLLLVCGMELTLFAFVLGLAWSASRATRDELLLRWPGGLRAVSFGLLYSIVLRVLLAVIVLLVSTLLVVFHLVSVDSIGGFAAANQPNVQAVVDVSALRDNPVYFWLTLTLVSFVVAGLREELWRAAFLAGLRALWPRRFGSRAGAVAAVAVAAVVFGLGHVAMGPTAVVLTTVLGFGLGLIMVLHRSIWPAVIAHGFFDATTMALIPWVMQQTSHMSRVLS